MPIWHHKNGAIAINATGAGIENDDGNHEAHQIPIVCPATQEELYELIASNTDCVELFTQEKTTMLPTQDLTFPKLKTSQLK